MINPEDAPFLFLNIYGILSGSCLIFAVMAALRRQWERVQYFVILIPFLMMSFMDCFYRERYVELFSQLLYLSD